MTKTFIKCCQLLLENKLDSIPELKEYIFMNINSKFSIYINNYKIYKRVIKKYYNDCFNNRPLNNTIINHLIHKREFKLLKLLLPYFINYRPHYYHTIIYDYSEDNPITINNTLKMIKILYSFGENIYGKYGQNLIKRILENYWNSKYKIKIIKYLQRLGLQISKKTYYDIKKDIMLSYFNNKFIPISKLFVSNRNKMKILYFS
jgi:hypothetical protein